jgi:hypothetical protein
VLTLENSVKNVITTKGLFALPLEAFSFNWGRLNQIFTSTLHKFEKFCPIIRTIQTLGGNPIIMPEDCIMPRSVAFGNSLMIPPQAVPVENQSISYNRSTRQLSVFTNTGSSAPFKVQYLGKCIMETITYTEEPYTLFENDKEVEMELQAVPIPNSLSIVNGTNSLSIVSRTIEDDIETWILEGTLGTAELNLSSLKLNITLADGISPLGDINISYIGKYKGTEDLGDDSEFFETWLAGNILTSLGGIKLTARSDKMPNDISADDLKSQGLKLLDMVQDFQKEKSHWWAGLPNARV